MKAARILTAALLALAYQSSAIAQKPDHLSVTRTDQSYVLTVPLSRLEMIVPAANLSQKNMNVGGSTANPRYFYFTDASRGLILSGWFEPASQFRGVQDYWAQEQAAWKKKGLPVPENVSFAKLGGWDVIFYEHPAPGGLNSHLRGHFVKAGTWIDLHISVTNKASGKENRSSLESVLNGVVVNEKREGAK